MCCASLLEAAIEGTKGDAMRKLRIFQHISLDGVAGFNDPATMRGATSARGCGFGDAMGAVRRM
jgi:hypothetical protein